jgi:hypothetical protein
MGRWFGWQITSGKSVAMARMLCCHDLLNDLAVHVDVGPLWRGEGKMAFRFLRKHARRDDLLIYDRGFPSFALFFLHRHYQVNFLARCKRGFNNEVKAFVASGKRSLVVTMKTNYHANKILASLGFDPRKAAPVKVRLIRVELESGEIEVLATSLVDTRQYPTYIFKDLYQMRWGVEVFFDRLKNTFQADFFNGQSVQCIYQEVHAAVMMTNVQSLLTQTADREAKRRYEHRMHTYKVNRSVSLGILRQAVVDLFLGQEIPKVVGNLIREFVIHVEPVRPGRKYPRVKRVSPPKYRQSRKPVL